MHTALLILYTAGKTDAISFKLIKDIKKKITEGTNFANDLLGESGEVCSLYRPIYTLYESTL